MSIAPPSPGCQEAVEQGRLTVAVGSFSGAVDCRASMMSCSSDSVNV